MSMKVNNCTVCEYTPHSDQLIFGCCSAECGLKHLGPSLFSEVTYNHVCLNPGYGDNSTCACGDWTGNYWLVGLQNDAVL